jgi:pimeloyl-ACP methyl ester carboxylesterase
MEDMQHQPKPVFPNVSPRWLLGAAAIALVVALGCAWLTLCLLFWQGSWQLLYHPKIDITRTPATAGLSYESIHFASTETGTPQLSGWWLPVSGAKYTVLYLHGADGNLSDSVDTIAAMHRQNLSVFAFDYRGYGQSLRAKPSEKHVRQDADWAIAYLTQTRHIPIDSIILYGSGLGANLAAEVTATHDALAGVVLEQPQQDPLAPIFDDSRSRMVPAHWIVSDRYDLAEATQALRVSSLWFVAQPSDGKPVRPPQAYQKAAGKRTVVTLTAPVESDPNYSIQLKRWLDDL